jgi:hypothetical protein
MRSDWVDVLMHENRENYQKVRVEAKKRDSKQPPKIPRSMHQNQINDLRKSTNNHITRVSHLQNLSASNSHAQVGLFQHGEVVEAVADGEDLGVLGAKGSEHVA